MKAHVGVDNETRLIHSVAATAANMADSRMLPELLHGEETEVWGDQAYQGHTEVIRQRAPKAVDRTNRRWRTKLKAYPEVREQNPIQSKTRSRVEHVFAVIQLRFGFTRVRFRGLAKNFHRLLSTCALANLYIAKHLLTVAHRVSGDLGIFDAEKPVNEDDLKRKIKSGRERLRTMPQAHPLRWDEVPHQEISLKAQRATVLRSPARAADDSRRFLLKRRLPHNEPSDHLRYIEIESALIVETLRQLRDQYRSYFEEHGCNPIVEMHWVVIRNGVKDWAIMALRSAAVEYVAASQVDNAKWKALFDLSGPYNELFLLGKASAVVPDPHEKLTNTIMALLPRKKLSRVRFSRRQRDFGCSYQAPAAELGRR